MIKNKMSFEEACNIALTNNLNPQGIGEYREKSIHAVLKNYYENEVSKQEVKINKFYADIQNEYGIIEIQTRNFNTMREKLELFLSGYDVTIVYPLVANKYINWVNSSNDKDYMKKSPRHDNIFTSARELYKIKTFLNNPRLHFVFVYLDMIELKNLDGWSKDKKKGASTINKVPTGIEKTECVESYKDFLKFVSKDFKNEDNTFTCKDFAKMNKCSDRNASVMMTILKYLKLVEVVRKEGKKYIYKYNL